MKKFHKITILVAIGCLAVVACTVAASWSHFHSTSVSTSTPFIPVSAAQVPDGWYSHDLIPKDTALELLKYIALTKHKDLPQRNAGAAPYDTPQITVSESKIDVTPEQQIKQLGLANENAEAVGLPVGRWTTYKGHKMFTITLELGGDAVMIFGGDKMYTFTFIGESQDRNDFWRVINYYAEDSSLLVIPRAETLATCKTVNLPPGQEYDIVGDTETGYVTIGYWPNSSPGMGKQETYAFLNYNDDLSHCTPSVHKLLSDMKIDVDKRNADQCIEMKAILSGKEPFPSTTDEQHRQTYVSLAKEFIKNNCTEI